MDLPDVQESKPSVSLNLTRVGVSDVTKLVEIAREGERPIILQSDFDVSVDLPSVRKGANLSRNFEAIDEVIEEAIKEPVYELEDLCDAMAKKLLERHEYATRAEVNMKSNYYIQRKTPVTNKSSQQVTKIFVSSIAQEDSIKTEIGVELYGITVCPCAQGITNDLAKEKLEELGVDQDVIENFLETIPQCSHNQRGRGKLLVKTEELETISIDDLIDIVEKAMSGKIFELQKREDEAKVVLESHKNPRFVEDCVRRMLKETVNKFPDLPDDTVIYAKQVNEESIHQHNAFAERRVDMGTLRQEIDI